jgi:hypothetical protein
MKKLFYPLFLLLIMGLTFASCENPTPDNDNDKNNVENTDPSGDDNNDPSGDDNKDDNQKVESNCTLQSAQKVVFGNETAYYFDITNGDLYLENNQIAGNSGDYLSIMMFADSQENNNLPKEQKYDVISAEELTEYTICVVGGAIDQEGPFGTYGITITEGEVSDLFLCIDGDIKIEGNEENATMTANLEFVSLMTEETFTKEYIYNGAFDIKQYNNNAPQRVKIQK